MENNCEICQSMELKKDKLFQNISVFQGLLDEDRIKLIYEYTPLPK